MADTNGWEIIGVIAGVVGLGVTWYYARRGNWFASRADRLATREQGVGEDEACRVALTSLSALTARLAKIPRAFPSSGQGCFAVAARQTLAAVGPEAENVRQATAKLTDLAHNAAADLQQTIDAATTLANASNHSNIIVLDQPCPVCVRLVRATEAVEAKAADLRAKIEAHRPRIALARKRT